MPIPPKLLEGQRREYSIEMLLNGISNIDSTLPEERKLLTLVLPPWQRPEVWDTARKIAFIEGIYLGFGCGQYVVNGQDWLMPEGPGGEAVQAPMSGWLLDGQQRIASIRDYVNGDLVIFGDVTYPALSQGDKRRFGNQSFPCFQLDYINDESVLKALYARLAFGGMAHTTEDMARVK